jgi:DNA-binding NtrC family response regulator
MSPIVLLGLDNALAEPLRGILTRLQHEVLVTDDLRRVLKCGNPQVVFTSGDSRDYREILRRLTADLPFAAVIVVNRIPDNMRWLDALDRGAADYCGAPFDPVQIQWLIEGAMRTVQGRKAA